jgi:hypothetical protein
MSELTEPSVSDSFNLSNKVPQMPGQINWKAMAIYSGVVFSCTIFMIVVIHYSQKSNMQMWIEHSTKMNGAILAELRQSQRQVSAETQLSQETKPIADNIIQKQS